MSAARTEVLTRIRRALDDAPDPASPTRPAPAAVPGDPELFAERVADYSARVTRCAGDDDAVAAAVAAACVRHRARRIAMPAGLPAGWIPDDLEALRDEPPLEVVALDGADGALTGAALGIAETGTIVLDGGPDSGRRALTLVPDLHVCVVRADDVVASVPAALAALGERASGGPITFISGPSATSDIELDRVEGVHGPRRLEVVLAG
jgi:L-lactate dehydrogenase complex protein LldG